ncbi:hypothetical protein Xcel_3406 (plasmid) [Xylanimonas cellulosilytica DSM 15894]|uniref:ADP ribosyltransferase domain-containing protein n=1 Tax=Xylanimonas cellulosilytica (strain DSM 15894 / JCM 12276 / CECT 5975 / KCTC 9989 / LMG 20990 / NBRC 107835 / XIL07) TaxID=446471 RepID=D1C0T9_XYLCX|nr:hypothetical protein [Xylanimonas cellulosilytica]ACZ32405.1 hypothetical protein Xcel_3406 [Xylanimonas cellulosilytica DSM 15894]
MPRQGRPEPYVVDADRGSGTTRTKQARILDLDDATSRAEARAGLRELDAMVESMPGLGRLQKDRERITPRGTLGDVGDPRMVRSLPDRGQVRKPISARQRNARSKTRGQVQATVPLTQLKAQRGIVTRPDVWMDVNDHLSEAAGDLQALPERDQEQVRRVDRSIQAYERSNDRGHVVYTNVQMPYFINASNLEGFVRNNFEPGTQVSFDRFTFATHQLHETVDLHPGEGMATFEIQTRRGAYLGGSDKRDNTSHLLPRGMDFEVVGTHTAYFQYPSGRRGSRTVIQLRDITPDA